MSKLKTILTLSIAMAVGFFLIVWVKSPSPSDPQETTVATLQDVPASTFPNVGGHFQLIDQNGKARKDTDFRGRIMMVYFGYTFCPDICPTGLHSMTLALNMLKPSVRKQIQPVFVSVDPERDTPEQLKSYIGNFHKNFIALTGTQKQLDKVIKDYHVYAVKAQPDGTSTEYLIDHSSIVYVMDRHGKFIAHFNHGTEPEQMAQVLSKAVG